MRRKNNMRGNKARFLLILLMVGICSSCVGYSHKITPSIDISNMEALKGEKRRPLKVAILIPNHLRDHVFNAVTYLNVEGETKKTLHPVETGKSTIELFENSLEELFDEVSLIDESIYMKGFEIYKKDLDKYFLVFIVADIVNENASEEKRAGHLYTADIGYKVTVISTTHSYSRNISVEGKGIHKEGTLHCLGAVLSGFVAMGTLGLSNIIYGIPTAKTQNFSNAFARAQEEAFNRLVAQLKSDSRLATMMREEVERQTAKCALSTSPLFTDQHAFIPNSLLDAGEKGEIVFSISNSGDGSGFDIQLKIVSENSYTDIVSEYDVGEIPPGETKKVRIPISADLGLEDGWEELYIETKEKRGYDAPPVKLKIQTARLERPELAISSVEINDGNRGLAKGNGNGIPENEETVELVAFIKNSGEGPGRKVKLELEEINSGVEVVRESQEVGTVNVGEIVKGKVVVRIPRTFDEKRLEYRLRVADARKGAAEDEKTFALDLGILRPVLAYGHKVKDSGFSGASGNGNGQMENGEDIALIITPRNNGTTGAKNVSLTIDPPYGVSADRQRVSIGSLAQGKDGQPVEFILSIPRTYDSTSLSIPIKISQSDFPGVEDQISIPVRLVKPRLELAGFRLNGIDGNTTVGKRQDAKLEVIIKNSGELAADGLTVTLHHSTRGVILDESKRTIRYGTLQPGMETDNLKFPLFIQGSAEAGSLPIRITISQDIFPQTSEPIQLAIQEGVVHTVVVKGEKLKSSRPYRSPAVNFPPKIIIDRPSPGAHLTEPEVTLVFRVSDDEEVRKVDIRVNGISAVKGVEGLRSQKKRRIIELQKRIALSEGSNTIEVIAFDNQNTRVVEEITVNYSKELGISRTFAIIIGIADYRHEGIADLKYTEKDAAALKDFLMSGPGGAVPQKRIKYLVGKEATADNIRGAVSDWLSFEANKKNDRVILYFSGHGVKYLNRGYFLAYDTDPGKIGGTSVRMREIAGYLDDLEAKTVIFISDACHSGAALKGRRFAEKGIRLDGGFLIDQFSGEGHITISAAKEGQSSIELPAPYEHGLFTYYLIKGLKGEADRAGNRDKKVDIHELYQYVYHRVSDDAGNHKASQNPKMDIQGVEGDIIMAIVP